MLLLGSKTFTVGGVTVFSDHADPSQFWYLPAPVVLEKRDDGEPQFTLIKYRPAAVTAGVKGGGFLMFTAALPIDTTKQDEIQAQIASYFPDVTDPRLSPVPFDEGSVQCVALDLQGPGGTAAPAAHDGAFEAVEKILGATVPSLMGNNDALFSLTVSQEGATILDQAFDNQLQPVGIIYQLKYTGVRPALDVKITADMKRAYEAFSIGLTAQAYYVSVGIDAVFEKLVQDGVIKVQVTNLAPNDAENKANEGWALQLFKDNLISDWFKPSLSPTTAQGLEAAMPAAPKAGDATKQDNKADSPKPDPAKTDPAKAPAAPKAGDGTKSDSKPDSPNPDPAKTEAAKAVAGGVSPPTTGKGVQPVTPGANPANTATGAAPFGAALRLRYVQQNELKTIAVEYNRQDAVQRTYAPQGYFGVLLSSLVRVRHVLDVDVDDPFFRKLAIVCTPPAGFNAIGLGSLHVVLDYGDPSDPAQHKHGEMMFDEQHRVAQTWEVYKNATDSREYTYQIDWHFNSEPGWDAEKSTYSFPMVTTESADLTLNPFNFLTFAEVRVSPGRINWNLIDFIEVDLDYTAPGGWHATKHFEVHSDTKEAQSWKLRLEGKQALLYARRLTHHLKDGTTVSEGPRQSTVLAVVVEDPFFYLNIELQPLLDPAKTKLAYLDVKYEDTAASYTYEENFTLPPASGVSQKLKLPVLDLQRKKWTYRVTLVGTQDQINRGAWTETDQNLIFVTDSGVH
jgi:hypothetical protein